MPGFTAISKICLCLLVVILTFSGCKTGETTETNPSGEQQPVAGADEWLNNLIQQLRQEKAANPPAKIFRYTYRNKVVYYLTSRCCDIPGKVYDIAGNVLCEPDGGITGKGDGRCPDFFDERTDEIIIWEDKREQE
jgi:hypothetical protein